MSHSLPSSTLAEPHPILRVTNARRWSIVALLFTASLINYFDRATISFALPLISAELHLGPEAKGVLLSAFFWIYSFMQIPAQIVRSARRLVYRLLTYRPSVDILLLMHDQIRKPLRL